MIADSDIAGNHCNIRISLKNGFAPLHNMKAVLVVCRHKINKIAGGILYPNIDRWLYSQIFIILDEANIRGVRDALLDEFGAAIGRRIIDNNHFIKGYRLIQGRIQCIVKVGAVIVVYEDGGAGWQFN